MKILVIDIDQAHNKRVAQSFSEDTKTQISFFNSMDLVLEVLNGNPQAEVKKKEIEKCLADSNVVLEKMKNTIAATDETKKGKMKENLAIKAGEDKDLKAQKQVLENDIKKLADQIAKALEIQKKLEAIIAAKNAELIEAQQKILPNEEKKINLVLVDRSFLGTNSAGWLKDLREKIQYAENQNVPIVTMGYNEGTDYIRNILLCGVSDYFIKPVDLLLLKNKTTKLAGGEVDANDKVFELKTKTQINLLQQVNIQKMSEFEMEVISSARFTQNECVEFIADVFSLQNTGRLLASCVKSEPDPTIAGAFVSQFSFVGLLPQTMNELRKWLKRQYVEQKQKEST